MTEPFDLTTAEFECARLQVEAGLTGAWNALSPPSEPGEKALALAALHVAVVETLINLGGTVFPQFTWADVLAITAQCQKRANVIVMDYAAAHPPKRKQN